VLPNIGTSFAVVGVENVDMNDLYPITPLLMLRPSRRMVLRDRGDEAAAPTGLPKPRLRSFARRMLRGIRPTQRTPR